MQALFALSNVTLGVVVAAARKVGDTARYVFAVAKQRAVGRVDERVTNEVFRGRLGREHLVEVRPFGMGVIFRRKHLVKVWCCVCH